MKIRSIWPLQIRAEKRKGAQQTAEAPPATAESRETLTKPRKDAREASTRTVEAG